MTKILATPNSLKLYGKTKKKLCHACGSEEHEIKDCESKVNIYIIDQNQVIERKLTEELEKYVEVKSIRGRQDKHGNIGNIKGNIGMACLATEEQAKLAIKMPNKIIIM